MYQIESNISILRWFTDFDYTCGFVSSNSSFTWAVVVVIVLQLDLQAPVQSMPIITEVVSSNPVHDEVYSMQHYGQWLSKGRWFSPGTPVYSTNKTDRYDITGILFKVALNTINPTHRTLFLYSGLHVTFTNFSLSEPLITFTLCITVVESWT